MKEKIAELAYVTSDTDFTKIIEHMDKVKEVNTDGIEPMYYGCVEDKPLREDIFVPFDSSKIMKGSHCNKDNYFVLPRFLED